MSRRATAERQPISGETDAETMSRILDRLEYLLFMVQSGGAGNQAPVRREIPINWNEVDALRMLTDTDPMAARASVSLLTPGELVARFGFPTRSEKMNDGLYLSYLHTSPDGKTHGPGVGFELTNGFVTHLNAFDR